MATFDIKSSPVIYTHLQLCGVTRQVSCFGLFYSLLLYQSFFAVIFAMRMIAAAY